MAEPDTVDGEKSDTLPIHLMANMRLSMMVEEDETESIPWVVWKQKCSKYWILIDSEL